MLETRNRAPKYGTKQTHTHTKCVCLCKEFHLVAECTENGNGAEENADMCIFYLKFYSAAKLFRFNNDNNDDDDNWLAPATV